MLARIRKSMEQKDRGFTLIELLVVIIIIGILAAIAIPVFLKQRQKGFKADMKSAAKNAATAAESYGTEHGGDYSGLTLLLLQGEGFKSSSTLGVTVPNADANHYCIKVTDSRLAASYYTYNSDVGAPQENQACA
jgi:type IV pilus assembly protein PilA